VKPWKLHQWASRSWRGKFWTGVETLSGGWRHPTISVTAMPSCPMRCNCCPWDTYADTARKRWMRPLSMNTFERVLNNTPRTTIFEWCGFAEAFMNPQTPDMIIEAYRRGHRIQLSTTLIGLGDFDHLRGVKFDKFVVHMPDSENFIYDEDVWLFWLSGLRFLKFHPIVFMSLGTVSDRVMAECLKYGVYEENRGIDDKRSMYPGNRWKFGSLKCGAYCRGGNYFFLWPNGDLSYCSLDFGHENVVGNLSEQTLDEIKNGEPFKAYERAMKSQDDPCLCRRCPLSRGYEECKIV
jgi:radical SAM protein with 4Fe4S-binding SPASM domain